MPMLRPKKQWLPRALQGTLLACPGDPLSEQHPITTPGLYGPPDSGPGLALTWGQVCTEGSVDQGEVQHDGCVGVLRPGKQVALAGVLQILREHLNSGEGDASVQAVLLCRL